MYTIVKFIKQPNGKEIPVIILDNHEEIWSFDTFDDAEKMRLLFEKNSDSGHRYEIKKAQSK
jgi:hypothetical protein